MKPDGEFFQNLLKSNMHFCQGSPLNECQPPPAFNWLSKRWQLATKKEQPVVYQSTVPTAYHPLVEPHTDLDSSHSWVLLTISCQPICRLASLHITCGLSVFWLCMCVFVDKENFATKPTNQPTNSKDLNVSKGCPPWLAMRLEVTERWWQVQTNVTTICSSW